MLSEMKEAWREVNFLTKPFKNTQIIFGWDQYTALLDEHIVNT